MGSNHRPLACKASALPLSYAPSPPCSDRATLPRGLAPGEPPPVSLTRGAVRVPGQAPGPPPRSRRPRNPPRRSRPCPPPPGRGRRPLAYPPAPGPGRSRGTLSRRADAPGVPFRSCGTGRDPKPSPARTGIPGRQAPGGHLALRASTGSDPGPGPPGGCRSDSRAWSPIRERPRASRGRRAPSGTRRRPWPAGSGSRSSTGRCRPCR